MAKRAGNSGYYEVQGEERLGAALIVCQIGDAGVDVSRCTIQWNRMSVDGRKGGPISGELLDYIPVYGQVLSIEPLYLKRNFKRIIRVCRFKKCQGLGFVLVKEACAALC